jgi:hypothetical protein
MSIRLRLIAFSVVCVLAIAGATIYALSFHSKRKQEASAAPGLATTSLASIVNQPRIVFRNTSRGTAYGKVAMVALSDVAGPRAMTGDSCDRVYSTQQRILCLSSVRGLVTTYKAEVLSNADAVQKSLPLAGIPSRARLSADGNWAATTSFTAGDSYLSTGFSTRTVITDLKSGAGTEDLEGFTLLRNGRSIKPVDRNYWGVTFSSDDNTFYATVAFGGSTYLVRGDIATRTARILRTDAECPSLSPDGKQLVYKKRAGQPAGKWRLASYDIATGVETMLAETRSVDDQVEWLDNKDVIYGLPRTGADAAIDDVFSVPADGTGAPRLLIAQAFSPAVVR